MAAISNLASSLIARSALLIDLLAFSLTPMAYHRGSFEGDQTPAQHFIEHREECVHLLFGVHDRNHYWEIHGKAKNFQIPCAHATPLRAFKAIASYSG
jgi:hypothetical protein